MILREPYKTELQCSPNKRREKLIALADEALGEGHGANWAHDTPSTCEEYYLACAWWINASWGPNGPISLNPSDSDYIDIIA